MAGLQVLEDRFKAQGFHVLGFFSDDFGNQGGSPDDIDACTDHYNVTFEQFVSEHVKDPDGGGPGQAQPVFSWLAARPNPGPAATVVPQWNFHKYLLSRHGELVKTWDGPVYPGDDPASSSDSFDDNPIVVAVREELSKP